jgi:hypothetical protein
MAGGRSTSAAAAAATRNHQQHRTLPRPPPPVLLPPLLQVITRRGRKIPVFSFLYPGAHFTLLYSHGNAVDCGLLRDVLIDLALNLRVNVVAYDYTGYGSSVHVGRPSSQLGGLVGRKRIQARPEARQAAEKRKQSRGWKGATGRLRRAWRRLVRATARGGGDDGGRERSWGAGTTASNSAAAGGTAGTGAATAAATAGSTAAANTATANAGSGGGGGGTDWSSGDHTSYGTSGGGGAAPPSAAAGTLLPSEADTYADADAVAEWLLTTPFCPSGDRVILYGQSLGSGPSVYLACGNRLPGAAGLVLHSGLASAMRVVTDSRALACLDIFDNVARIKRAGSSSTSSSRGGLDLRGVMVLHGQRDEEVPVSHGHALAAAAEAAAYPAATPAVTAWYPPLAGHNDLPNLYRHEYYSRLRSFVASLCVPAATGGGGGNKLPPSLGDDYVNAPVVHPYQLGAVGRRLGAATAASGGAGCGAAIGMPPPRPLVVPTALTAASAAALPHAATGASLRVLQSQGGGGGGNSSKWSYPYAGGNAELLPPGQQAPQPTAPGAAAPSPSLSASVAASIASVISGTLSGGGSTTACPPSPPESMVRQARTPRPGSAAAAALAAAAAAPTPTSTSTGAGYSAAAPPAAAPPLSPSSSSTSSSLSEGLSMPREALPSWSSRSVASPPGGSPAPPSAAVGVTAPRRAHAPMPTVRPKSVAAQQAAAAAATAATASQPPSRSEPTVPAGSTAVASGPGRPRGLLAGLAGVGRAASAGATSAAATGSSDAPSVGAAYDAVASAASEAPAGADLPPPPPAAATVGVLS